MQRDTLECKFTLFKEDIDNGSPLDGSQPDLLLLPPMPVSSCGAYPFSICAALQSGDGHVFDVYRKELLDVSPGHTRTSPLFSTW